MALKTPSTHRVSIHVMYYKIARGAAVRYHERDAEYAALETGPVGEEELSEYSRRMEECYAEREQSAVVAITFSGMTLEAFFYDYAAEELGDAFVKEHLDKLDLKAKFLIYPRLVCGRSTDKSKAVYESLGRLVKLRNELVHFKSKPFPVHELDKVSDFHTTLNLRLKAGVDDAVDTVMQVMTELDVLHGSGAGFALRMHWSLGKI
jgi:hypothetical protein